MNDCCVYEHWRPDTNQCFYVGKGRGKRAYQASTRRRNKRWACVVGKLERNGMTYDVHIVKSGLTNDDALLLEIECIKFWKEIGVELTNMTNGGEGALGRSPSEETRAKLSRAIKNSMTEARLSSIRNPSLETRERLSIANKNRSPEFRAKLSAASKGNKSHLGKTLSLETRAKIGTKAKVYMKAYWARRRASEGVV